MPIPKPKDGEDKQEFVSRCMGDDVMKKEFPDKEQRAGVCYSQWDKTNEGRNSIMSKIEEKIEKYLNEAQQFDVGDFIKQEGSDFVTYAQIVAKQKKGYKVAAFTSFDGSTAGKAVFKSTGGWYPAPRMIDPKQIPDKILKKIVKKSGIEDY